MEGDQEMQLQYCLEIADRIEKIDIPRFDLAIRRPLADGEFFLDKLRGQRVSDEILKAMQETASKIAELCSKHKGATKPFYAMQNAMGLYATPLHYEV